MYLNSFSWIPAFILVTLLFLPGDSQAFIFGSGDAPLLLKIISQDVERNAILRRSLNIEKQNRDVQGNLLKMLGRVFEGYEKPQDYLSIVEDDYGFETPPKSGSGQKAVIERMRFLEDLIWKVRYSPLKKIVTGKALDELALIVQDIWHLVLHLPNTRLARKDALSTFAALQAMDVSRRSLPYQSMFDNSLANLLPDIRRAMPGRSIQLNTHLNYLQAAGLQHLVETESAAAQVDAIRLMNEQERENRDFLTDHSLFNALVDVVRQRFQKK